MSTDAQLSANQANSQHSTGPCTPEGKAASSRNSLRHGFRSQSVLLPGDDPAEYDAVLAELTSHFGPAERTGRHSGGRCERPKMDLTDRRFLREMADAEWRLRRVRQCLEDALTRCIVALAVEYPDASPIELQARALASLGSGGGPSYGTWLRYETKFERQYERAYKGWATYQDFLRRARDHQSRLEARDADTMMKAAIFAPLPAVKLASTVQTPPRAVLRSQPTARTAVVNGQIARNAPCPCGSGEKYKRCCGKNAPAVLSEAA